MKLKLQKKLAADVAGVGKGRVKLGSESLDDIKSAITKADIRDLIREGAITISALTGTSRHRARKRQIKRSKGRQRGMGRRKGKVGARTPKKRTWMNKIRLQRSILKRLRDNKTLETATYRKLYLRAKGGFFRSRKHLLLYMDQQGYLKGAQK